METSNPGLILASTSVTRNALLAGAGLRFTALGAPINEREIEDKALGKTPAELAQLLARAKAVAVSEGQPEAWVIGADQTLDLEGEALHKVPDLAGAARQLDRLAGKTHALHSGVALAQGGQVVWSGVASARLTMRAFSAAERDQVLALEGDKVLGSVGAYRLEGPAIRLFSAIEGDYFTILGLPLIVLLDALRRHAPHTI